MSAAETNIKWIMLLAGAATCGMVWAAIAPQAALLTMFGETLDGPLAEILVRNWGALITLVGAMLIWGAFNPQVRVMALTIAVTSKLVFIALVLSYGRHYVAAQAGIALALDLVWVALLAWYLISARRRRA
jgi:hypothetical protein